jgi:ribonuclease G
LVSPDVLNRFKSEDSQLLMELERSHTGRLVFRSDPAMHREHFSIVDAQSDKALAEK